MITVSSVFFFRQCMCIFKDIRNFEKLNSMVQDTLSVGIRLIQTLPEDNERELKEKASDGKSFNTICSVVDKTVRYITVASTVEFKSCIILPARQL